MSTNLPKSQLDILNVADSLVTLSEASGVSLNKGDTVTFDWKQGKYFFPVEGIVEKVLIDRKSVNPAQRYLYQIRLLSSVQVTVDEGQRLTVKRTSMKNIEKIV
jgi:hypothetical protein